MKKFRFSVPRAKFAEH